MLLEHLGIVLGNEAPCIIIREFFTTVREGSSPQEELPSPLDSTHITSHRRRDRHRCPRRHPNPHVGGGTSESDMQRCGPRRHTWRCSGRRWVTTSVRARHTSDEHASDNQRVRDDERRMRCAIVRSRAACLSWNALPPVGTHERSVRNRSRTRCAPTMERSPPGGAFTHLVRLRSSSQQSPHPGARGLVLLTPNPTAQVWCRRPQRED